LALAEVRLGPQRHSAPARPAELAVEVATLRPAKLWPQARSFALSWAQSQMLERALKRLAQPV
jgi:hypothetical protein